MRIPTTAQVGCVVLVAAMTGFFGTRYWVESRTLRAVDMPVSLARGIISTGRFNLNVHGFYSILIGEEQRGGNPSCNVELETGRISSIGGRPTYRYQWLEDESRAKGRNTITGSFLGGFEGEPGMYYLDIKVLSDTGCLDAGKPHLYVLASNDDFYRWNQRYESLCLVWALVGLLGLVLIVASIYAAVRERSDAKSRLSIFMMR